MKIVQLNLDLESIAYDPNNAPARTRKRHARIQTSHVVSEMMIWLFPEDYPDQFLSLFLAAESFIWTKQDVSSIKIKMVDHVYSIMQRTNSSLTAIDECLQWAFTDEVDTDFSLVECANEIGVYPATLRKSIVSRLAMTLRELKRKPKKQAGRIDFLQRCLRRCRELLDVDNVELTPTERAAA